MDIVYIRDLQIETVIGVYDWERECRQIVCLSLDMAMDIRAAAANEDLSRTLDYNAISQRVTGFVQASEFQLLETLAERVAALVMQEFGVSWLRLQVGKPGAVAAARDVGVRIERGVKPD